MSLKLTLAIVTWSAILWASDDYAATAKSLEAELAAVRPGERLKLALAANNLGRVYAKLGRWPEAEKLYRQALDIFRTERGPRDPDAGVELNNLGVLYETLGRYEEARRCYNEALAIHKIAGTDADVANDLANLAVVYLDERKYSSAEKMMQRAIEMDGGSRPELIHNLGSLYLRLGLIDEAKPLLERARAIKEAQLGHMHSSVGLTINLLAECALEAGNYATAEEQGREAQAILELALGANHPSTLATLLTQALARQKAGRAREAEPLFRKVIDSEDQQSIPPTVRAAHLNRYAELLRSLHRNSEAKRYEQLARLLAEADPHTQMLPLTVDLRELSR